LFLPRQLPPCFLLLPAQIFSVYYLLPSDHQNSRIMHDLLQNLLFFLTIAPESAWMRCDLKSSRVVMSC
jgi:hypothetical protein